MKMAGDNENESSSDIPKVSDSEKTTNEMTLLKKNLN